MKKLMLLFALITCLVTQSCSEEQFQGPDYESLPNDVILEWNEVAYQAFGGVSYQHSLMAARVNAMTHLAMHDALNGIFSVYEKYAFTGSDTGANPIAAAACAAHTVLLFEIQDKKSFLDSALMKTLSTIPDGDAKNRGVVLGKAAGQAIIDARLNDGSAGSPIGPVAPSTIPGVYQVVPPFDFVFAPNWLEVKPFGLMSKNQFRSAPHPTLESADYVRDFTEVKTVGKRNSTTRSVDETNYANFWYEFSEAGWNRVARIAAVNGKLSLLKTARLFALVDMALADAYLAGWDSKFHYDFWRPYTAIRRADTDHNNGTSGDLNWDSELVNPPVQDYPSTHSALGNAAATVLANILGDNMTFSMDSPTALPGTGMRSFASFSQAADENASSRVMAGIHFRFSCEAGQEMGNKVGQWIADTQLKQLR
ncbi:MAG: vanadium-dependent haloperoxidase [Saprospiraceae bacterium]|nr:vanadium-dependent haloperoxidase [Saprospiraceae bacterium]